MSGWDDKIVWECEACGKKAETSVAIRFPASFEDDEDVRWSSPPPGWLVTFDVGDATDVCSIECATKFVAALEEDDRLVEALVGREES